MKSRGDSSVLTVLPVGGTYITQRNLSGTWRVRVFLDDRLVLESEFTLLPHQPPLQPGRKLKRSDENEFLVNSKFSSYRATLVPRAATCLPGEATPLGRANRGDIHSRRDRQSSRPHHQ